MLGAQSPVCLDKKSGSYIEIGTHLHFSIEDSIGGFRCFFVGAKSDQYIVTSPFSKTPPAGVNDCVGFAAINARYIHENRLFTFQTQMIETLSIPVPLVLWRFPESVATLQQRAQKRINCFISGRIEVATPSQEIAHTGVIKDISKSGCRFLLKTRHSQKDLFRVGEEILVRCAFPGISGEQQSMGNVVGISETDGELTIRIQFSQNQWWVPPYGE